MPKISAKFHRDHPRALVALANLRYINALNNNNNNNKIQVGWVKIGDFRQIAGYISKTVQDRRMVSIKVE